MRSRTLLRAFLCAALPVSYATAWGAEAVAEAQGTGSVPAQTQDAARPGLGSDIKGYFTAPLRWSGGEWAIFGGVLVAIGAAHHYDSKVRDHFVTPNQVTDTKDLQDALPAVAVVGATWAYAALVDSSAGRSETWNMVEAAALSAVPAYALKFASRQQLERDYVVPPLEGLWWADDMASFTVARDKSRWSWTLLILVPDWLANNEFAAAVDRVAAKRRPARLDDVRLQTLPEGRCVQTLHIGAFDDEAAVLDRMHHQFIPANGLRMVGRHHEIYLSDFRRVAPAKRRTILRQPVDGV